MARLSRVVGRIFGSGAGVDQIAKFGSLFAGASAFTTDPAQAQSLSNWLTGWFGAAIGGNAPAIEDMNAAFFVLSYQIAQILQAGVVEWNTDTTYYIGQFASDGAGVLYTSLTDANQGNALSDTTNWRRYSSSGALRSVSTTATLTPNDSLVKANAGSAGFTITLAAAADCVPGQPINLKKTDSTTNVVTITAGAGDNIDGDTSITLTVPNEGATLIPDGANSFLIF
jgi:hypothetical protein